MNRNPKEGESRWRFIYTLNTSYVILKIFHMLYVAFGYFPWLFASTENNDRFEKTNTQTKISIFSWNANAPVNEHLFWQQVKKSAATNRQVRRATRNDIDEKTYVSNRTLSIASGCRRWFTFNFIWLEHLACCILLLFFVSLVICVSHWRLISDDWHGKPSVSFTAENSKCIRFHFHRSSTAAVIILLGAIHVFFFSFFLLMFFAMLSAGYHFVCTNNINILHENGAIKNAIWIGGSEFNTSRQLSQWIDAAYKINVWWSVSVQRVKYTRTSYFVSLSLTPLIYFICNF